MIEKSRSQKLKRLLSVQRHIERMAENDLAETSRQRIEVNAAMDDVIVALGSMDPVHHAFSQNYADRFGRLTIKDQQLTGMQQIHEMRLTRERAKADRLEEGMKEALDAERREADDNAVYDVIDQQFATPASSKLQKP
ncbi:hypothetical protein AMC83_CH00764 [Rhizobium phaseoli]|jgi:hypothetical protein|uniref:Flagellar FliJ protein n=1 Tax=Rhizobium etli TaxID=29449 RepID=A0A7W6ZFD8_RHIET|nr:MULTISPECIES: hypothetical protein [Rhizobium]KEC72603.1 hypothetical protein RLPCCGM1_c3982 [Rhizobium leguminosarum bv. phaseoli CCGM1]ANL32838.1 hypothetical protein AMC89_CH00734 [Rhizobium phaseoli]ANL70792.1 hypothetical protein AMC83_CH00764 [Rhizobium phaseoli]ANL96568.1 hypothetical protein AMC79_CH00732 [Rhizobium phaseoli]MBB4479049.1 hypothetical protein [Rhizobium etli]